jgi:hypothetical protein
MQDNVVGNRRFCFCPERLYLAKQLNWRGRTRSPTKKFEQFNYSGLRLKSMDNLTNKEKEKGFSEL